MNINYNPFPGNLVRRKAADMVQNLHNHEHEKRGQFLALLLLDMGNVCRIGFHSIKGVKKRYNPYQFNPQELDDVQLDRPVTLLIHGRMHNQGVWKTMAKHLSEEEGIGAVFTLNLPVRGTDDDHRKAVVRKMKEINADYESYGIRRPRFHLVGYSNGGVAAIDTSEYAPKKLRRQISKLIMIGCHLGFYETLSPATRSKTFAIIASHDFLDRDLCKVPVQKKTEVKTTHLGIIRSKATTRALVFHIKQD